MGRRPGRLTVAAIGGVTICLLAATACGSSTSAPPSSSGSTVSVVDGCAGAGAGWRTVSGVDVDAARLGSGPVVVFGNDSGNSVCDWLMLAGRLAAKRFTAVVFSYYDASETRSVTDMLTLARKVGGTHPYALVGASVGGRLVIEVAARHPAGLAAIVSLSGERMIVPGYPDILGQARKVGVATLYVGSRADAYTDGARQQLQLHQAMRGTPNDLVQLDGADHGIELLDRSAPDGRAISTRIITFLQAQLR